MHLVLTFKHLMFQIVGNSCRYCYKILVLFCFEADIDGTILGRKHCIRSGESFFIGYSSMVSPDGCSIRRYSSPIRSFRTISCFHPIPPPFHPATSAYKWYLISQFTASITSCLVTLLHNSISISGETLCAAHNLEPDTSCPLRPVNRRLPWAQS